MDQLIAPRAQQRSHSKTGAKVKAESNRINMLKRLGFNYGRMGVHSARTMMLAELRTLLDCVDMAEATKAHYLEAVQASNCLGKRSGMTRTLAIRHLTDLYTLDPDVLLFRVLRFFWQRDVDGQPLLAMLCAYSRDPILRASAPFVLSLPEGAIVVREAMEGFIDTLEPGRFSKATLKSTAQNINSSWTQSGHLIGRVSKVRRQALATSGSVSYALLLGYVSGLQGEWLFRSDFTKMLDCPFERLVELAEDASRRGWISLKRVGKVVEVLFPNLITAQEMEWLREPD